MKIKMLAGFDRFQRKLAKGDVLEVGKDIAAFAAEDFIRDGIAVELDEAPTPAPADVTDTQAAKGKK